MLKIEFQDSTHSNCVARGKERQGSDGWGGLGKTFIHMTKGPKMTGWLKQ